MIFFNLPFKIIIQVVCKKFVRKQNWKEWYTSLREQLSYVRSLTFFDTIVYKPLQKVIHKHLLSFILNQQIELLQLMVLTSLRMDKCTTDDFNFWISNLIVSIYFNYRSNILTFIIPFMSYNCVKTSSIVQQQAILPPPRERYSFVHPND